MALCVELKTAEEPKANGRSKSHSGRSRAMLTAVTRSAATDPSETFVHARGRFPSGLFRNDMSMVLTNASDADIPELMTWFHDARSTQEWGGWVFRFPFDDKTFREDVQLSELDSFVAHSESTELIAFGQVRNKYGRGHLARLAVAPKHRGRGLGRDLVTSLCQKATELFACSEISLFVSKTNAVAIRCYKGLGFHEAPYPEDRDMGHKTLFMVRKIASN